MTTYLASVTVPLCQSSATVNVGGLTMSAWVFIHGSSLSPLSGVSFAAWGPSGFENQPVLMGNNITVLDTWYHVQVTFSSAVQADHISIYLTPTAGWSGTLYIDSVTFTGP